MKKIYYLILLVSLMFFGCDSTDNSENQKIAELNEKITVLTKEKMMLNQEIDMSKRIIKQYEDEIKQLKNDKFNFALRLIDAKRNEIDINDSLLY